MRFRTEEVGKEPTLGVPEGNAGQCGSLIGL